MSRHNRVIEETNPASLRRISLFLLVLCAVLFAMVVSLLGYVYVERGAIARLQGSLLAETALQRQLLEGTDRDRVVFPHIEPTLGFVLNPAIADATWRAFEGSSYRVNSLGLRGPEITTKPPGTKRILLVGDSVFFGWRLPSNDMLESRLQALLDARAPDGSFEVITIALPGWNTMDQDAFLRSHLARLDPDFVVWSLLRNDLIDTPAAVPPGMLLGWASPQKTLQQPVQFSGDALSYPAPALLERWQANLERISAFRAEFDVPVSILWWREKDRALIDTVLEANDTRLPVIHLPGAFRFDRKNWCIAKDDCHPTRWANDRLALAVMDELVAAGLEVPTSFHEAELDILELFREARSKRSTVGERQQYFGALIGSLGNSVTSTSAAGALFGLTGDKLQENGLILLRAESEVSALRIDLESPTGRPGPAQTLSIRVRDNKAVLADQTLTLVDGPADYRIPLGPSDHGLYEVAWRFRFSECQAPGECYSAKLIEARIL